MAKSPLQIGDLCLNHAPDEVVVDAELAMDEAIAHASDGAPFYLGSECLGLGWNLLCGFTHDFNAPDECSLEWAIVSELGSSRRRKRP